MEDIGATGPGPYSLVLVLKASRRAQEARVEILKRGTAIPAEVILNGLRGWALMPWQDVELRDEMRSFRAESHTEGHVYLETPQGAGPQIPRPPGFVSPALSFTICVI